MPAHLSAGMEMPADTRPPCKPANELAGYVRASRQGRIIGKKISRAGALPLHPAKGARPSGLPKGKSAKEQRTIYVLNGTATTRHPSPLN